MLGRSNVPIHIGRKSKSKCLCRYFLITAWYLWILVRSVSTLPMDPFEIEGYYLDLPPSDPYHRKKRSGLTDEKHDYATEEPDDLGNGYVLYRERKDWKKAHEHCEKHHGHLAPFTNKGDAEQVVNKLFEMSYFSEDYDWGREQKEMGLDRRYWIGLADLMEEGKWAWVGVGNALSYHSMWYPNQPDHVNTDGSVKSGRPQHCGSLWNPAYWKVDAEGKPTEKHSFDDLECDRELYFICMKDDKKLKDIKDALGGEKSDTKTEP